ncbi:phosphatase PAP2 family protein, partial [Nostoc punctiforme UO1]|uniref:phosphatase PAP2 family protein n=1 Tax=Nostoc punctiforme TaxID=272131 RepID=UPI0030B54D8A
LVLYIYSKDYPYNCFPSLHNALSVLSFFYWVQVLPKFKWIIGIFVLLIILSTLLIKQHYIPDVISGILLAIISFRISFHLFEKSR